MDQIDYKNMGQIDHYQNMGTKLTMTPKYRDQNDIFANFLILSTTLDCWITIYIYIYMLFGVPFSHFKFSL